MNLHNIIREEVNDFDWIKEIPSDLKSIFNSYGTTVKVWVDGIKLKDQLKLMDYLYDNGFQWRGNWGRYDTSNLTFSAIFIDTKKMEISHSVKDDLLYFYEDESVEMPTKLLLDLAGLSHVMRDIGQHSSKLSINEQDDFDWIRDTEFKNDVDRLDSYLQNSPVKVDWVEGSQYLDFEDRNRLPKVKGTGWKQISVTPEGNIKRTGSPEQINLRKVISDINEYQETDETREYVINTYTHIYKALTTLFPYAFQDKSLMKESNEFDWIKEIPINGSMMEMSQYLKVGSVIDVDGAYYPGDNSHRGLGASKTFLNRAEVVAIRGRGAHNIITLKFSNLKGLHNGGAIPETKYPNVPACNNDCWNIPSNFVNIRVSLVNNINEQQEDDFDWIRNMDKPIPINRDYTYKIVNCDNAVPIETLYHKLEELYGYDNVYQLRDRMEYNDSDNVIIYVEEYGRFWDGEDYLMWDECSSRDSYPEFPIVYPDEFMRYYIVDEPDSTNNINEQGDDFGWMGETPPEIAIEWMNEKLFKKINYSGNIIGVSKSEPHNNRIPVLFEKDNPNIDLSSKEFWDIYHEWVKNDEMGELISDQQYEDYLKEKKKSISFEDVKEFMMTEFAIRTDEDGTVWLQQFQETDGFMGEDVTMNEWPMAGPKSIVDTGDPPLDSLEEFTTWMQKGGIEMKESGIRHIYSVLVYKFGSNLIDDVVNWISNLTEREITEWYNRPMYTVPLSITKERS